MPKVTEPRMGRARIRRRWELPIIIYDLVTVCLLVGRLRQWVVCVCVCVCVCVRQQRRQYITVG